MDKSSMKQRKEEHDEVVKSISKYKLFVFKDDKSESFGLPICVETRGTFIRSVQEELSAPRTVWAKHPQDFAVYEIGEYDIFKGNVELYEQKKCLGLVQDFKISSGATTN